MHILRARRGFTLIEMSIVLVIIGLIVGGVLVGQTLISAAVIRAQITQIERFNTAVNTFRGKYSYLPGDIPDPGASQFGLFPRGTAPDADGIAGADDGNGLIEGIFNANAPNSNCGLCIPSGETVMFWSDLIYANGQRLNLIEGSFNSCPAYNGSTCNLPGFGDPGPGTLAMSAIGTWLPQAKIGNGNYVYVYSMGGVNYYGISVPTSFAYSTLTSPGITVNQAYAVDKKADDGQPLTGNITATYVNSGGSYPYSIAYAGTAGNSATPGSTTTCYDNNNAVNATQQYSAEQSGGQGVNCTLPFRFQ